MRKKIGVYVFSCALFLFTLTQSASAGSAILTWNANTEPDLAGYKIYWGTSARTNTCPPGGYANNVTVGRVTTHTLNNLTNGSTYYFSITAIDTSGNESCFSEQRSKLITADNTSDLNSDNIVNSVDFGILMSNWNSTTRPRADINQDGIVNSVDFGIMMSRWG